MLYCVAGTTINIISLHVARGLFVFVIDSLLKWTLPSRLCSSCLRGLTASYLRSSSGPRGMAKKQAMKQQNETNRRAKRGITCPFNAGGAFGGFSWHCSDPQVLEQGREAIRRSITARTTSVAFDGVVDVPDGIFVPGRAKRTFNAGYAWS